MKIVRVIGQLTKIVLAQNGGNMKIKDCCRAWHKGGGIGYCANCTQAIIDKNPELKALQEKGRAILNDLAALYEDKAPTQLFNYPNKTTRPAELTNWEDTSWHNDASASCWLPWSTLVNPRGTFVIWVQPDNIEHREYPDQPKFWLQFMRDADEGWKGDEVCIAQSNAIKDILTAMENFKIRK